VGRGRGAGGRRGEGRRGWGRARRALASAGQQALQDLVPERRIFLCPYQRCPQHQWRNAFTTRQSRNLHQASCPFRHPPQGPSGPQGPGHRPRRAPGVPRPSQWALWAREGTRGCTFQWEWVWGH